MAWLSGSGIIDELMDSLMLHVGNFRTRMHVYEDIIHSFESRGVDNLESCRGVDKAFDAALYCKSFVAELLKLDSHLSPKNAFRCAEYYFNITDTQDPVVDAALLVETWKQEVEL
jgi:hypothetical protein